MSANKPISLRRATLLLTAFVACSCATATLVAADDHFSFGSATASDDPTATTGAPATTGDAAPSVKPPERRPPPIPETFTTSESTWRPGTTRTPSLSEQFNRLLPKWLQFSGEIRERVEGWENLAFKPNNSDAYDLHRLRLGVTIRPTSWFSVFGQLQDARVFGRDPKTPPFQKTLDLRQAYVDLGNLESSHFLLRVGRQELNFGNGRLIGRSWWTNSSRSFDAIRATFQDGNVRVDAFASSVVIIREGVFDHHNEGNNLHGIYGQIRNVVPNSILEPYGFWHISGGVVGKDGKSDHLNQYTWGVRFVGVLPANFDYRTEMAIQRGTLGPSDIRGWLGHWTGGYTFVNVVSKPRLFVEYNYGSGDDKPTDLKVTSTFDPIYPTQHDKLGLADQFAWRNIKNLRFGSEFRVSKKLTLASSYHDFWLASAKDALYPARGSVFARDKTGKAGTHIGEELDFQGLYWVTPQTRVGAGYGHIFAGSFLKRTTSGKDFNAPYFLVDYVF
jgi:hypothetical protein